ARRAGHLPRVAGRPVRGRPRRGGSFSERERLTAGDRSARRLNFHAPPRPDFIRPQNRRNSRPRLNAHPFSRARLAPQASMVSPTTGVIVHVLIADDDPISRKLVTRHLRTWGYEPLVASDGGEAWELILTCDRAMLAILDWSMPRL